MPSTETTGARLSPAEGELLLDVAEAAVDEAARTGRPLAVDPARFPAALRRPGAAFVTLREAGRLRGCIGSVAPVRPLVQDVAENARHAALDDPRFPPVQPSETPRLDIEISVLDPPEPIRFTDEEDLLRQVQPGVDGLILEYGPHRGLLLPAVWEELPDPRSFVRHLKLKAGLPAGFWADGIRVERFATQRLARPASGRRGAAPHGWPAAREAWR